MSQPVAFFPAHVTASEAQGIASRAIFEGLMKPEDMATATTVFTPSLEYLPVWRVAVEATGFHLGLGSARRARRRVNHGACGAVTETSSSTHLGVNHGSDIQLIVAHRHFPLTYLPLSSLLRFDSARMVMGDVSQLTATGAVLPVDVSRAEAEHEVVASVMRRVAPEMALFQHYEPKVATSFAYVPLYIVRYAYNGMGRRHTNEEFFVTICAQRGTILAKHHPYGGGLVGALGRFFVGPGQHHAPPPPPQPPVNWTPWAPPPPPPPQPRNNEQIEPQGSQVLAIASSVSLVEARSRIARAISEAPGKAVTEGAPLLVHAPFWRIRMSLERPSLTEAFRARGVLATSDPNIFIVPALGDSPLDPELAALNEIRGFDPPEMSDSRAIAPVERRTLEAGAILLEAGVSREVASSMVAAGMRATPSDIASARLIYYPLYVQQLAGKRKYLVLSATTGKVLGARYAIPLTPLESVAASA